ncbi:MAG: penicillin-binding protein [Solirubrobacteraceae bacterium]|nr:penicillin-binding protein [Solirubrobacteraceae bacterium]
MVDGGLLVARGAHNARRRVRRRRLLQHGAPLLVVAIIAFTLGAILGSGPSGAERALASRYVRAWSRHDLAQMYSLLDRSSQRRTPRARFAQELRTAAATATLVALHGGRTLGPYGNAVDVRTVVQTRIWGRLHETLVVPFTGSGADARVHLEPEVLFPGLRGNERLRRTVTLPARASVLAADGTPLAEGSARTSPIPGVAVGIVGTVGPIPAALAAQYAARGYPANAHVGLDGLERIFEARLAGTFGGRLLAGHRLLAAASAIKARAVKTTITPALEQATLSALNGSYAGMAVMNPRTGAVLALAGIAFSDLQPPGSTMKIITVSAALQAGLTRLSSQYPVQTAATIEGYTLQNANGEACGGTLLNAFAVSCNSVFAPLGVRVGARRLVAMAERFGFNQPSSILGAAESTIPSAATIGDALAVGSSAIGQGMVQSTPLEMADVAATIAMGGRRPIPTLLARQQPRFVRVISPRVAHEVQRMMLAVVAFGTGTAAQIPGVAVAGKTGTAELKTTTGHNASPSSGSPQNTDAWFVGYAPAGHPRIVVGTLFPNAGAGGSTAAPPARQVIAAGLKRG